jgi:hypothetical protein
MISWQRLGDELDRWDDAGLDLDLWLRDDDAIEPTAQLEHLLSLCHDFHIPVLLAVIPGLAHVSLAARLLNEPLVRPCQHGWRHTNHAPAGEKPAEFGQHRPLTALLADVQAGRECFAVLFPENTSNIFVPPWNRIAPDLATRLPELGLDALSAFRPIRQPDVASLQVINPDVDIVNWKAGRALRSAVEIEHEIVKRLTALRIEMPLQARFGLLLHHLVQVQDAWALLNSLLAVFARHPRVNFADPAQF